MSRLGKYELGEILGRGGYGTVYRAQDTVLGVERAVKVLHPALGADPEFIERFRREAQVAARLEHPHIVPVFDLDQDQGSYFLAMKYMPGGSLKELLARDGRLSFERALLVTEQIASALEHAASQPEQLVHRDLKPGNVLFEADGTARLADFGFSKALIGASSTSLSASGGLIGTPAYMAPEVWRSQPASQGTDVYSLACVFFEMITGEVLFDGESPADIMTKHMLDGPHFPRLWPEGVPTGVESVLSKALAKEPLARIQGAGELVTALRALLKQPRSQQVMDAIKAQRQDALLGSEGEITPHKAKQERIEESPQIAQAKGEIAHTQIGKALTGLLSRQRFQRFKPWVPWLSLLVVGITVIVILLSGFFSPLFSIPVPLEEEKTITALTANVRATISTATGTMTATFMPITSKTPGITLTPTRTMLPTSTVSPTSTPRNLPMSITDEFGVPIVLVPAGPFLMGDEADVALRECQAIQSGAECQRGWFEDEEPVHTVILSDYYIDIYEVTNFRYAQCVTAGVCNPPSSLDSFTYNNYFSEPEYADYPVIFVRWEDAQTYCEWRGARLPTEAEWEKAARGTDGRLYPWGNIFDGKKANFCDVNCNLDATNQAYDDGYADTAPVGSYSGGASPYGVMDMIGNVGEWVYDWYAADYYLNSPIYNPNGPDSGPGRVLRGGSWSSGGRYLRTGSRDYVSPDGSFKGLGFRCARSP